MNPIEAMMLTEAAADNYLRVLDERFAIYFPERIDVGVVIKSNFEAFQDGVMTINEALAESIEYLDEMDEMDEFGTQGWRYSVMGEY